MLRTINRKWLSALLLAALLVLGGTLTLVPRAADAQTPVPDPALVNKMEAIAKSLYCPVCVGIPLDVCDTQACEQWRNLIIDKLKAGQSEDQIRQYFIDQYGDRVLGAPPPQGFNLGAYLLPATIFIVGIGILLLMLRGWAQGRMAAASIPAPAMPTIPPEYAERIARELEMRERE